MTQVDAIYRRGVFEPLEPVHLVEEQRVRLSIDSCSAVTPQEWLRQAQARHADILKRQGPLPDSTPEIAADRLR